MLMSVDAVIYLKDTSKGPSAQVVEYGVTIDGFKGRPALVHGLNALSQTVHLVFLHYKTQSKVKTPPFQSASLYVFIHVSAS